MPIASHVSASIRSHAASGVGVRPALIPYITAGYPSKDAFAAQMKSLAQHAALIEVGVPFSDPMADGVTIQRSSKVALENGVTLAWILDTLTAMGPLTSGNGSSCPVALMSYLNPVISAFGTGEAALATLALRASAANVSLLIIPDLPYEESAEVRAALHARGIGLVQLVSPVTPPARAKMLAEASDGFLYAVTVLGVTGVGGVTGSATSSAPRAGSDPAALNAYLDSLRAVSPVPVCAGFGIRTPQHVRALAGHADGAIVGSAIIDAIERGEDPAGLLAQLAAG